MNNLFAFTLGRFEFHAVRRPSRGALVPCTERPLPWVLYLDLPWVELSVTDHRALDAYRAGLAEGARRIAEAA